jgi:ABC-type bacteriocin/lantibiotic exporter with double-glycine peptidase domain
MNQIAKQTKIKIQTLSSKKDQLNEILLETFDNIAEIQAFRNEKKKNIFFYQKLKEMKVINFKINFLENTMTFIGALGNIVPIYTVIVLGMYLVRNGKYQLSDWLVIYYLMEYSNTVFTCLPAFIYEYTKYKVAHNRILTLQNQLLNSKNNEINHNQIKRITAKNYSEIRFENVNYVCEGRKILKNIDFSINLGEKILIKGRSGSGKSTLMNLISGLLLPTSGKIILPQHSTFTYSDNFPFLFPMSIEENVLCTLHGKEKNEKFLFTHAIQIAQLEKDYERLAENFADKIFSTKNPFSGGELQKISLARAFMRVLENSKAILLLDEAVSAIDLSAEQKIYDALFTKLKSTVILISHKDVPYEYFNKIIYIQKGEIEKILERRKRIS